MNTYIYQADLWCEDCALQICQELTRQGLAPENPNDEYSFNSDSFPKGPYRDGGGESDSPSHCGAHGDCLNAITVAPDWKIGAWLENELTSDGLQYVTEAIAEDPTNPVVQLWAEWYEVE